VNEARRDLKREQTQSPENQENDTDGHQHGILQMRLGANLVKYDPQRDFVP
jgi:hypothetical protein